MKTTFEDWNRISNNWSLLVDIFNEAVPSPNYCRATCSWFYRKTCKETDKEALSSAGYNVVIPRRRQDRIP